THNGSGSDLGNAITAANTLKGNGTTHVTGVAVGKDIDLGNIGDITGSGIGLGGLNPDVHQSDTSTLVADVKALATELCGGTVTIHKTVQTGAGVFVDGPNWQFASLNAATSPVTTDAGGLANLKFEHDKLGTETITETGPATGYTIQSVDCGSKATTVNDSKTGFTVDVGSLDIVTCDVVNTPALGSISVSKVTTHGAGGPFAFNVSGPNAVSSALSATTAVKDVAVSAGSVSSLFPGVYTISETSLPAGWSLTGIDCGGATIAPSDSVVSPSVSIVLHAGENAVCTYTNDELPSDLSIVKAAGAPAAVNGGNDQRIDYTLTVDNAGPADAHTDATVTDMLPAGASLVSVTPPVGVSCDSSALPKITCTIPAGQLEVADPAVAIGVTITVPTGAGTIVNKTIVSSPDDPAPCTVTADGITCTEPSNNYSQASTVIPQVAGVVVTNPSGAAPVVAAAAVEAANLAFTGSHSMPFVWLGAILLGGGTLALVLARRRRRETAS
ncbi:MAG: trimeric autotransporter adhesin, partial [Actinomycetota bacterium]|nr:trimeric autotransporter adhesin [Actinomycetota bacterium]